MMSISRLSTPEIVSPLILMILLAASAVVAETRGLGGGFKDHGVFGDVAENKGMVCAEDGEGNPVVLVWLSDHRKCYALGVINAQTGDFEKVPMPVDGYTAVSASLLSSRGRYYTYSGGYFLGFDPKKREFTVVEEGPPGFGGPRACSMTEDDNGVIWAAVLGDSEVFSYKPETGELREYGSVYEHSSLQYPRTIAADDQGWVYVGLKHAAGQIVMLNTETGKTRPVIPRDEVVGGGVAVSRDVNGRVYGSTPQPDGDGRQWYELYQGMATRIDGPPDLERKPIITEGYKLRHRQLPNGERVKKLDAREGLVIIEDPESGDTRQFEFETGGEGGTGMGLAALPDGTLAGGTYHPHRFFRYDPATDEWVRRDCYPECPQWNTLAVTDDRVYAGCYSGGVLLEWNPAKPWVPTEKDNPDSNPKYLGRAYPDIVRPYSLLAYPDDRTVIMAGKPIRGGTGGGLMFYDRQTGDPEVVSHEQLIQWHSTMTMLPLPDDKVLAGTTTDPAIGGIRKADGDAELYILDVATRQIEWHAPVIEGAEQYDDMIMGPDGKVFGIVNKGANLFVFDPVEKTILHQANLKDQFGRTVYQQGSRIFVQIPDGRIFILFRSGIARLDPETYEITMVAEAPSGLGNGGAYVEGRLYLGGGADSAHLLSWEVPSVR